MVSSRSRTALRLAAVAGFLAVAIGAFGAHGLKDRVSPEQLVTFEVGVRYHAYHALALLGLAALGGRLGRAGTVAAWCFFVGIVIFGGSLYTLALTGQRWLGMITPIGGVCFLAGWVALGVASLRSAGDPPVERV